MKEKVSSRMFHLLWKMISKTKQGRTYFKYSWKEKDWSQLFYFKFFLSKQNVDEHNMSVHKEKKSCPQIFFFSNEKLSTKKGGRTYYFGSWRKKYTDCYKTKIWLKNVLTLVYTSGVAQTKNGQNFKSWSCQTNAVEYWAASNF